MDARIYVAVPCHGRKNIVEQCVPTVRAGMTDADHLALFFDGVNEDYDTEMVAAMKPSSLLWDKKPMGIEAQRRFHFNLFGGLKEFTHLYLTDSDALHDPAWRTYALRLQQTYGGAPVCLYNTDAHVRLVGNTIEDDPHSEVIWRRVAPGISYLLTRAHAEVVIKALPHLPLHWHWDWTTPSLLGHEMAISRVSFVDHIGWGGMHHPAMEGVDGGDIALNPTAWLVAKRREVANKLKADELQRKHENKP